MSISNYDHTTTYPSITAYVVSEFAQAYLNSLITVLGAH